jgi:murein DD-endopeptidase MepM/ murein hydrolase activator NlpD
VAFWITVGTVVIMAGWSIMTATYFAFRDDVLKGLLARQAEQQTAYEDRIAELRARIDRTTSRQMLDQEKFEQKLEELLRRQTTLESRATALNGISDPSATGSLKPAGRGTAEPLSPAKPSPISDVIDAVGSFANRKLGKESSLAVKLGRVEASLERVERRQSAALAQMEDRYEGKVRKIRGVLAELGIKADALPSAVGGPFVPVKLPPESRAFERSVVRVSIARAYAERLDAALVHVPVRQPITGEIDLSSPFGVRVDPFLHVAAMHTGLDFRGNYGESVHATAAGTVISAGRSGGYGNMVEIDHGNGLSTRYGHLSQIDVHVGQKVRIGEVVGHIGSTGRSTGPHLHYETRIDGEAVDPKKFLSAGFKLSSR